jgi:putative nucleotidyltransferase with HDIG domain
MPSQTPHVLLIGLERGADRFVAPYLENCKITRIAAADVEKLLDVKIDPFPGLVLCGEELTSPTPQETAQLLRMQFTEVSIFYITKDRSKHEAKSLLKNGYNDIFTLTLDQNTISTSIREALARAKNMAVYRPVRVIDLKPNTVLDFDTNIHLPANNKTLRYSNAGEVLSEEKAAKLEKYNITSVYVSIEQMPEFYKYSAERLKDLNSGNPMGITERRDRMQKAVRSLITGMVTNAAKEGTIEEGRALLADCQNIVSSYIMDSPDGKIYQRVLALAGDMSDAYSHCTNVSTYAALFAMGLSTGNPEELAMAGLLHDIGMVDVPEDVQAKDERKRTEEEQATYEKHVEATIALIKNRKLLLSENVLKIILQHHERFDGRGYPKGLPGSRIAVEAQILGIADRFDYMTSVRAGRKRMTPAQALKYLKNQLSKDPGEMEFDPALVTRVLALFPEVK